MKMIDTFTNENLKILKCLMEVWNLKEAVNIERITKSYTL
jgi:hypothetical protein